MKAGELTVEVSVLGIKELDNLITALDDNAADLPPPVADALAALKAAHDTSQDVVVNYQGDADALSRAMSAHCEGRHNGW